MEGAVKFYKPIVKLTHRKEVMRMYRRALRECFNWAEDRDLFNEEATKVRSRFNANMHHAADSALTKRLMQEAYAELEKFAHPDPYVHPHMPGGSSFMRNSPPPLEVCFPSGIPHGYIDRRLNPDMSNIPLDQPYADKFFTDFINKRYWIDKS